MIKSVNTKSTIIGNRPMKIRKLFLKKKKEKDKKKRLMKIIRGK